MVFAPGTDDDPTGYKAATAQAYEMATGRPEEKRRKKDKDRSYKPAVVKQTPQGPKITNPYPDGIFSRIFGAENVDYSNQMSQQQAANIEFARRNRFFAPQTVDQSSLRKGFGSLFGSSAGEATALGELQKQTPKMSTPEMISRGVASLMTPFGPLISMADPRGTEVTIPSLPDNLFDNNEQFGTLSKYDPNLDPRNKPGGMISNMLSFFTGGVDPRQAKDKVSELLPDFNLSGISSLLPDFNLNMESETNDLDEGPVADPFYPDMPRVEQLPLPELY